MSGDENTSYNKIKKRNKNEQGYKIDEVILDELFISV